MKVNDFIYQYIATIAAVLTILLFMVALWHWLRSLWERLFLAKPRDKKVREDFTYHDVIVGTSYLVARAKAFVPDFIIGINRGGLIVGGIIAKHLEKLTHSIIVERNIREFEVNIAESAAFLKDSAALKDKKVLLVDDRLNSGNHMETAYEFLRERSCDVRKLVFAWVDHPSPKTTPDVWAYRAISEELTLPWERKATKWDAE